MKTKFSTKNSLLWGVVALVLGLMIAFNSNQAVKFVIILLGVMLLVMGGVEMISFLVNKEKQELKWGFSSFGAIMAIIFGFVLILKPDVLTTVVMFVMGAVIAMLGVWQIITLSKFKKLGAKFTGSFYIYPIVLTLAGIYPTGLGMLFFPKESVSVFVIIAGLLIASFGVAEILLAIMIKCPKIEQNATIEEGKK
ncbi:MAG: DUF308 domain-containing protein [Rikenellaceae bacterium]